jgi:hypothetical protein
MSVLSTIDLLKKVTQLTLEDEENDPTNSWVLGYRCALTDILISIEDLNTRLTGEEKQLIIDLKRRNHPDDTLD